MAGSVLFLLVAAGAALLAAGSTPPPVKPAKDTTCPANRLESRARAAAAVAADPARSPDSSCGPFHDSTPMPFELKTEIRRRIDSRFTSWPEVIDQLSNTVCRMAGFLGSLGYQPYLRDDLPLKFEKLLSRARSVPLANLLPDPSGHETIRKSSYASQSVHWRLILKQNNRLILKEYVGQLLLMVKLSRALKMGGMMTPEERDFLGSALEIADAMVGGLCTFPSSEILSGSSEALEAYTHHKSAMEAYMGVRLRSPEIVIGSPAYWDGSGPRARMSRHLFNYVLWETELSEIHGRLIGLLSSIAYNYESFEYLPSQSTLKPISSWSPPEIEGLISLADSKEEQLQGAFAEIRLLWRLFEQSPELVTSPLTDAALEVFESYPRGSSLAMLSGNFLSMSRRLEALAPRVAARVFESLILSNKKRSDAERSLATNDPEAVLSTRLTDFDPLAKAGASTTGKPAAKRPLDISWHRKISPDLWSGIVDCEDPAQQRALWLKDPQTALVSAVELFVSIEKNLANVYESLAIELAIELADREEEPTEACLEALNKVHGACSKQIQAFLMLRDAADGVNDPGLREWIHLRLETRPHTLWRRVRVLELLFPGFSWEQPTLKDLLPATESIILK